MSVRSQVHSRQRAHALLLGTSVMAIMLGTAITARAQSAVPTLDTITAVATKTDEKAIDSLSAVSTVRQEQLDMIAPKKLSDVLYGIPGVWVQERGDNPETSINIRGLQDFGRVAVVVDGARQNFQHSGHNANGTFFLEPELLSGLDVVRGPVANIYGSGAIGGVASFTTKNVEDILRSGERWGAQAHAMAGSNQGSGLGSVFGAARMGENADAIAGIVYRSSAGYEDGRGVPVVNSGNDIVSGLAKVTVRPWDGHQIRLSGITSENTYKTGQPSPIASLNESVYDTKVRNDIVTLGWKYAKPEDRLFDFDGNVYWTNTKQDQLKILGSSNAITGAVGDKRSFNIETMGFDVHNTSRFDTGAFRHAITYGGDYFVDDVKVVDPTGTGDLFTPTGQRTVSGAFVQLKSNYSSWLELINAVRYDQYHLDGGGVTADGDRFSPKTTLGITPVSWFTVYGTYAEGYRAPAVTETLVAGAHPPFATFPGSPAAGFTFVPNPNLSPEVGKTKEIGINIRQDSLFTQGDALRIKANVYRNDVDDFIELTAFGPITAFGPAFQQYRNIGHARLEGVEVEGTYDTGAWFAGFAGQHIRGENSDTGGNLISVAPDKIAATFGMRFWDRKMTALVRWVGVTAKKAGDIPDNDANGVPDAAPTSGYGIVNVSLAYQPTPDVQLNIGVDNIFDRYYVPYLNESSNNVFAGPGMTVKGGLTIRFGSSS